MSRTVTAGAVLLLAAGIRAQDPITVRRVAGPPLEGRLVGLTDEGGLRIRTGGDAVTAVRQENLVSVAFPGADVPAPRGAVRLDLVPGDRVIGVIEEGNFDEVAVGTAAAGSFRVFLDHVAVVVYLDHAGDALDLPERPDDAGMADELFLQGGDGLDRLPGGLQRLQRTGVVFDSAAGKDRLFSFLSDRVTAVRLAPGPAFEMPDALLCVATFRDGTRLTGTLQGGPSGELRLDLAVGPEVALDRRLLRTLTFKNTAYSWLSDMDPLRVSETPYLEGGPTYGLLRDEGFGGAPLRIGGQTYRKGIALHAESTCVFRLSGQDVFKAEVGVDPVTRGQRIPGSVRLEVLADDQEVWSSGELVAGDPPVPVRVEGLAAAGQLVIRAEFASSLGTGARAVLGDAMVLRR